MMTEEGIITGMIVHPGNYRDGDYFKELLDLTIKSGIDPDAAYGDKAYCRPDVLEEIKKLSYKAFSLTSFNESCSIQFLYDFSEIDFNNNTKINDKKANPMQQLFFYFLSNSLTIYRNSFNELSEECVKVIEKNFLFITLFYFI